MRFHNAQEDTGLLAGVACGVNMPVPGEGQIADAPRWRLIRFTRQGLALVLSSVMILIPMGQAPAFAQDSMPGVPPPNDQAAPPPAQPDNGPDTGQPPAETQALGEEQLDQLVAPLALYPDALVAQMLAASTYPTQVV